MVYDVLMRHNTSYRDTFPFKSNNKQFALLNYAGELLQIILTRIILLLPKTLLFYQKY